jgi:hypothetical protein
MLPFIRKYLVAASRDGLHHLIAGKTSERPVKFFFFFAGSEVVALTEYTTLVLSSE